MLISWPSYLSTFSNFFKQIQVFGQLVLILFNVFCNHGGQSWQSSFSRKNYFRFEYQSEWRFVRCSLLRRPLGPQNLWQFFQPSPFFVFQIPPHVSSYSLIHRLRHSICLGMVCQRVIHLNPIHLTEAFYLEIIELRPVIHRQRLQQTETTDYVLSYEVYHIICRYTGIWFGFNLVGEIIYREKDEALSTFRDRKLPNDV